MFSKARRRTLLAVMAGVVVLTSSTAAFAQDGSRIVMRRPLDQSAASGNGNSGTPPATCGTPGNPCTEACTFWDPRWVLPEGDDTVCVGETIDAVAVCKAYTSADRRGTLTVVPDATCEEESTSYHARCS